MTAVRPLTHRWGNEWALAISAAQFVRVGAEVFGKTEWRVREDLRLAMLPSDKTIRDLARPFVTTKRGGPIMNTTGNPPMSEIIDSGYIEAVIYGLPEMRPKSRGLDAVLAAKDKK